MAVIEGMDGNGKRKSRQVLFLPPVVTVAVPLAQSVRGRENALEQLELSSLNNCSDL